MKIKKFLAAAMIFSSLLITGCGGQMQIGYVDGSRIMNESAQIKSVMDEAKQKVEEVEKQAQEELAKNPNWTDEEKMKAQGDIQRKVIGINQAYATQLKHKFDEALADIAKAKNLDVVVDSSKDQPIILKGGVDVTEEVLQKLQ